MKNIQIDYPDYYAKLLLMSDLHWDNPKCQRDILKLHLDEAKETKSKILINGDLFCLMQGRADPRRSKDSIRPEHNTDKYIDAVIDTALDWFSPYAHNIAMIGYGNHENAIIKNAETDVLSRFVELMNLKNNSNIQIGGYGGIINITFGSGKKSYKMAYIHGYGGGGIVTKGLIQHQREETKIEGVDAIWSGHVHEDYEATHMKLVVNGNNSHYKPKLWIRTSTYKDEYKEFAGWAYERGAPPKKIGGRWMEVQRIKRGSFDSMVGRTFATW